MWAKIREEITIENVVGAAALGLIFYGVSLVYVPAAFVVVGLLLLLASYIYGRNKGS